MLHKIMELMDCIDDELADAQRYAMLAGEYRTEDKELAEMYIMNANARLNSVEAMHTKILKWANDASVQTSEDMRQMYGWMHKRIVGKMAKVRSVLEAEKKA